MSEQKNTKAGGTLTDKIKAFVSGEVFSYLFFGVCTTVVNIVVFQLCCTVLGMHALISNIIAWVFAVAFAYVTNRIFVFHSRENSLNGIAREAGSFVGARLFSFGLEELLLWISKDVVQVSRFSVTVLGLVIGGLMIAKLLISVLVVILNYVFSKLFIFKQKKD